MSNKLVVSLCTLKPKNCGDKIIHDYHCRRAMELLNLSLIYHRLLVHEMENEHQVSCNKDKEEDMEPC